MCMFSKKNKAPKIDIFKNHFVVDDVVLDFPLSLEDIEIALGKPDRTIKKDEYRAKYIYDDYGIVFNENKAETDFLKKCKVYVDDEHTILSCYLYYGDQVTPLNHEEESELPKKTCESILTLNNNQPSFFYDRASIDDFNLILWSPYGANIRGRIEKIEYPLSISYRPEIKHKPVNFKIKKTKEEMLHFDNLNFKLAIIQELMYDLDLLDQYFDIYEFADQYPDKNIDTESTEIVKEALDYFENLPIPKRFADKIERIVMDGGNDIYLNIVPQWDGEDDSFDLNEITLAELQQFPNLKVVTIMSSNFEEIKGIFESLDIEVEYLSV